MLRVNSNLVIYEALIVPKLPTSGTENLANFYLLTFIFLTQGYTILLMV